MTIVQGYAVRWDDVAEVDGQRERFDRGAFKYARSTNLRVAHDPRPGAVLAWAVPVVETVEGLFFSAVLDPSNEAHRRVIAALRSGMNGVSFGYRPSRVRQDDDGCEVIEAARLIEISLTGDAAFSASAAWIVEDIDQPAAGCEA
jgi:HK97 family phage prohead protease